MITPILVLDSKEKWGPLPVESVLGVSGVRVHTGEGATRPLGALTDLPRTGGRIDFPATMKPVLERPGVGYHRVFKQARLFWHQFWLFYLYNPKKYGVGPAATGNHEGDWEFVQLGCKDEAGEEPVIATASQHQTGGKKEEWRMVHKLGRPVFYVARDSHANYFTPVSDWEDKADGKGVVLDAIEWRPFGDWTMWPGRWGNSDNSPKSPGHQGSRWHQPAIWHGQAR